MGQQRLIDGDPAYLREVQYGDGEKLAARIELHERFSRNPVGWHPFLFDLLGLAPGQTVLDVGCGKATVWTKHARAIPEGTKLWLTDFSEGMLDSARDEATMRGVVAQFRVMDAQQLSFPDQSVDVLLAAHMLYHVPDRDAAIAEFRRVLRPGGLAIVATNGKQHLHELFDLVRRFHPDFELDAGATEAFGLENGAEQLSRAFDEVERVDYEDGLDVTDASALVRYIESMDLPADAVAQMDDYVRQRIEQNGVFSISKQAGVFRCK